MFGNRVSLNNETRYFYDSRSCLQLDSIPVWLFSRIFCNQPGELYYPSEIGYDDSYS